MEVAAILPLARSLVAGRECGCVHSSGQTGMPTGLLESATFRILPRWSFFRPGGLGSPDRGTFGAPNTRPIAPFELRRPVCLMTPLHKGPLALLDPHFS